MIHKELREKQEVGMPDAALSDFSSWLPCRLCLCVLLVSAISVLELLIIPASSLPPWGVCAECATNFSFRPPRLTYFVGSAYIKLLFWVSLHEAYVQRVFVVFQTFSASLEPCTPSRCPRWTPAGAVANSSRTAGPCCATGRSARGTTIWSAPPVGNLSTGATSTTCICCAFILSWNSWLVGPMTDQIKYLSLLKLTLCHEAAVCSLPSAS